jgi:Domain of unknown function (DUF5666)
MNVRFVPTILFGLGLALAASAQDAATPSQTGSAPRAQSDAGNGGRGEGRGWGSGNAMGRGTTGTVTEVTSDHYTVKTETGETYTVHYSANTRILKQQAQPRGEAGASAAEHGGNRGGSNPPTPIKATDIKVGDAIAALGEVDASAKSVGATMVLQIDPERAKQLREREANYGKTWLMGKVTAIDGVKVTLTGVMDHTPHSFLADENTTFRKRRDPITLADIQVGDNVRVEGALKDGTFLASSVIAMGPPPAGTPSTPGNAPPQ